MSLALAREIRKVRTTFASRDAKASVPDDPVEFARSVGVDPDPWQVEVLSSQHPRKILCCGRQTGKSTVGAILTVHTALTVPGSTILVVAPGERQAKLLFSKALSLYRQAGYPLPAHSERRTGLELSNGSVIEALPAVERTTRGYSVDLLLVDEAAAVPDMDYHGILPALIATQGEQVLLSTPRGKRGFFWEIWHSVPEQNLLRLRTTGCASWSAATSWAGYVMKTSKSSGARCLSSFFARSSTANGWRPKALCSLMRT
jgi:hypothetical protein